MSRHELPAKETPMMLAVGWDNPLETFFGIVCDTRLPEEDEIRLWVGTSFRELTSVSDLALAVIDYAELPAEIVASLVQDYASHEPSRSPRDLQDVRAMINEGWLR
jgi:hypothetical protein